MQVALASLASVLFASACVMPGGDDDATDGAYRMNTTLGITIEQLLPQTGANVVSTLRDFQANPAHTLLDLAENAGVPAVGKLCSALPGVVEDELEDWIDGEIAKVKIAGVPATSFAGEVVALVETALTQVCVRSTLTIDGATATHHLTALDLAPAGISTKFELGGSRATSSSRPPPRRSPPTRSHSANTATRRKQVHPGSVRGSCDRADRELREEPRRGCRPRTRRGRFASPGCAALRERYGGAG